MISLPFLIEIVSYLIIAISCFVIYFKTRELYELTSYTGIKYFRNTFLFFGITLAIRLILHLIRPLGLLFIFERPDLFLIFQIASFISVYASSMALIYLLLSIFWKKIDKSISKHIYLLHIIALLIGLISVVGEIGRLILIIFQILLFILLIIISLINYRNTRHKKDSSALYLLYLLIFALWIIADVLEFVTFLSPIVGLIAYLLSLIIFLIILYKVLKRIG